MDTCLYYGEIGSCPLSSTRIARTFADFIHSGYTEDKSIERV